MRKLDIDTTGERWVRDQRRELKIGTSDEILNERNEKLENDWWATDWVKKGTTK